jgi:hypothetical protein
MAVPTEQYNILQHDIEALWSIQEWENLKGCHDCKYLAFV